MITVNLVNWFFLYLQICFQPLCELGEKRPLLLFTEPLKLVVARLISVLKFCSLGRTVLGKQASVKL